jgi:hypothetical protein
VVVQQRLEVSVLVLVVEGLLVVYPVELLIFSLVIFEPLQHVGLDSMVDRWVLLRQLLDRP